MYNIAGFTLNGMYNYFELAKENGDVDHALFDNIRLYQGGTIYSNSTYSEPGYVIPAISKTDLINEIMENCGELLTYRQIPLRFQTMVEQFFNTNYHAFERIWQALHMDYNPIDNYDRHEYITNIYNSTMTNTDTKKIQDITKFEPEGETYVTDKPTGNTKVTNSPATNSKETVETFVYGENSSTASPDTKTETTPVKMETKTEYENNYQEETTTSYSNDRKDTTTFTHEILEGDIKDKHTGDDKITNWTHGNVGVTESSKIMMDEIESRKFNFYEFVSDLFEDKLLLSLY